MKESEIKHALEKIHWAFLGALDTIDRYNDILTEHLEKTGDETEEAVKLVISLCDYMIDDGTIDLSEDLQEIHDKAIKITGGEYGEIPKEAQTDELQPLLDRILINIANIWVEIQKYWEWEAQKQEPTTQAQNKADSSTKGTGMGSNATAHPETPPVEQRTPKVAALLPYMPKPVGRPIGEFANTIADTYKDKTDTIQEHTRTFLASMTDPKAVIALFVVYFQKGILKQCPTYWQTLRLLGIEAEENTKKEKLCPFGVHQRYDEQRRIYFDSDHLSLNETDRKQDNGISGFIQDANNIYKALLEKLNPQPQKEARKRA